MRLGWLADAAPPDDPRLTIMLPGGSELSSNALLAAAPPWAEVVRQAPGEVGGCDAYVIQNCVLYGADTLAALGDRPVIKCVRDAWLNGNPTVRAWLLEHAALLIFNSPPARENFAYPYQAATACCPPPLDLARFRAAAQAVTERRGIMWAGHFYPHKGVQAAVAWANTYQQIVDFYGLGPETPQAGPYVRNCGYALYADMPRLLAEHEAFLFLPRDFEPFGRTVGEAWAAGCKLIINERIGASWWLAHAPEALEDGAARFWRLAAQALSVEDQ